MVARYMGAVTAPIRIVGTCPICGVIMVNREASRCHRCLAALEIAANRSRVARRVVKRLRFPNAGNGR